MERRDVTSSSAIPAILETPADGRTSTRAAKEITPWQIAQSLPKPWCLFHVATWREALRNHPDRNFVGGLLNDIENGVALGYDGPEISQCHSNHLSATTNSHSVINELSRELNMHRKAGPFLKPPFPHFVGSPLDAIPKKHSNPPRCRLIHDLSWPSGRSVNNFIPPENLLVSTTPLTAPSPLSNKPVQQHKWLN